MRTGELKISRGSGFSDTLGDEPRPAPMRPNSKVSDRQEPKPVPSTATLPTVCGRVDALERVARLRSLELLTAEEFTAAKAVILADHRDDAGAQSSRAEPIDDPPAGRLRGPSLAESLFSWKFLPIGLVAGLALSFGAQPQETMRLFDQALRILSA